MRRKIVRARSGNKNLSSRLSTTTTGTWVSIISDSLSGWLLQHDEGCMGRSLFVGHIRKGQANSGSRGRGVMANRWTNNEAQDTCLLLLKRVLLPKYVWRSYHLEMVQKLQMCQIVRAYVERNPVSHRWWEENDLRNVSRIKWYDCYPQGDNPTYGVQEVSLYETWHRGREYQPSSP